MTSIKVNVALYGSLAQAAGRKHLATLDLDLEPGLGKDDLLAEVGIVEEDIGFMFINSVLCGMPGVSVEFDRPLQDGDHLGIFSTTHMWPYQYRDGINMTENLKQALREQGAMHHSYRTKD
ncbi:MAG: MoaD/ThiS family protein [Anaerolineales bacterium]|nr:MoaD/ThiS family protein [Anaerolineales bacterium]